MSWHTAFPLPPSLLTYLSREGFCAALSPRDLCLRKEGDVPSPLASFAPPHPSMTAPNRANSALLMPWAIWGGEGGLQAGCILLWFTFLALKTENASVFYVRGWLLLFLQGVPNVCSENAFFFTPQKRGGSRQNKIGKMLIIIECG